MKKNFIREMNIKCATKYKNPAIITLSGLPGSGKTTVAKELSKCFGLFVLSNDYIRNYYFVKFEDDQEKQLKIPRIVARINKERLIKLLINRRSLIIDANLNTLKSIKKFEKIASLFKYSVIKIKIDSKNDEENIRRIENRVMNYNYKDANVIGDNVNYSASYDQDMYFQIKKGKPEMLEPAYFDFIIENNSDLEKLNNNIENVSFHLKRYFKGKK